MDQPSGSTGVSHIVMAKDTARIRSTIVPTVATVRRQLAVVAIDIRTGVCGVVVSGVAVINSGADEFCVANSAVSDENIRVKVGLQTMIVIISVRRMTVLTNGLLLGVGIGIGQQGRDVTVTKLLTDRQYVHGMFANLVVGGRNDTATAVRPVLAGRIITVTSITTGLKRRSCRVWVTTDTGTAAAVTGIGSGAVKIVHFVRIVAGLADTFANINCIVVLGTISFVGEAGDCPPADGSPHHRIKSGRILVPLPVGIVTKNTVVTIGTEVGCPPVELSLPK